jgi:DNA-binding transcriptional ArsR family regulator
MVNHMVDHVAPEAVFAALGDERLTWLVDLLTRGDRTVSELAATLPISLQGTLKHLAVLEQAGVVTRRKQGRTVTVHLERERLGEAEAWLHRTRTFWARQLSSLAHAMTETDDQPTEESR